MKEILKPQQNDYLDTLLVLRYGYREEIPNRMVYSADGNYKVRMGWFVAVRNLFSNMSYDNFPQKDIESTANEYIKWTYELASRPFPRICTRSDIEYGNSVLDKAIESYGILPPKT